MPNVVCMNLQDAQDTIQEAGVFYSRSKDATGQGRSQILDRNWIVVGQTPGPGTPFGEGEAVLSVVKIGEPNDC
ncbi:PASTA domain-containing protein [Gordonia paraffinivorans]|uniref:PASTA domain-containing protein n=1 Tax=Gordonia paraffinivorans TaxID=175628 RepID=UPI0021B44E4E|nr:PASTA domain-containing protein [Gordonia paraffinivorans]